MNTPALRSSQTTSSLLRGRKETGIPDYSPLPVLTKSDVAKITSTEVGSANLNISERDIVEIDSLSHQLYDMLNEPISEDVFLSLKDMNVDPLLRKVKDTLQVDNLPATIKAMRVLSAQDRMDDVQAIWRIIRKSPQQCTRFAWTAYLTALATHGQTKLARKEMKEMVMSGIKPDSHIYGTLINGLVREGSLNEAYGLSKQMTESGIRPNNVVIASLIYGCIQKHQLSRAEETFDLMRNYIEESDSITTSLMIKVAELEHNTEKAIHLFDSLEVHQQPITQGCYHAVMSACAHSWRYDVMTRDYFKQMVNAGFRPTLASYHLLLQACATSGDFCEVDEVLRAMQREGVTPTAGTLSLVLKALGTASRQHLALPEHPAGNRRYTREEYRRYLEGYEVPQPRDRLSYVRDMRKRDIDDGLPAELPPASATATASVSTAASTQAREEKLEYDLNRFFDVSDAEMAAVARGQSALPAAKTGDPNHSVSTGSVGDPNHSTPTGEKTSGLTQGLSAEAMEAEIAKIEGRAVPEKKPQPAQPTTMAELAQRVEKIVMEHFLVDGGADKAVDHEKALRDLEALETQGREKVMAVYQRLGGDVEHVDYGSALWKKSVEEAMGEVRVGMGCEA